MTAKAASSQLQISPPLLSPVERELVCAVLEDCVDQLAVLAGIIPSQTDRPTAVESVMGDELVQILESQRQLERQFEWQMEGRGGGVADRRDRAHVMASAAQVASSPKAVSENMQKLQEDRAFLQKLVQETLGEVGTDGTFNGLKAQLQDCHQEKTSMEEAILREAECQQRVRELERQLVVLRKEKEEEIIRLNEQTAHLKDQLQELKAKTSLEGKYITKETEVHLEVSKCRHRNEAEALESEEKHLKQKLEEEGTASHSVEEYLTKHYEDLASQVDHWMVQYDRDLETKTQELHKLKQNKNSGLQKLEEMSKTYMQYNEVVVDHMTMKEKQKRKEEQEAREGRAATKLQAWWRGMMVRKRLGPFAPKKKGKGKKGKGKKGKKGKKKKK